MALKWLRDNLKSLSWVLWLVIGVFILLVFVEWGMGGVGGGVRANDVAATVGDEVVTYDEFRREHQALERRYREALGAQYTNELAQQLNLPIQALDQVINRKILLLEAEETGLRVSDAELREAILELPIFRDEDGRFVGVDEYRRLVGRLLQTTVTDFEESMREQILLEKLDAILRATAYVSDAEVEEAYRERAERASIRYVRLPAAEVAGPIEVTDAELAAYFEEHAAEYRRPEQRVIDYLLADTLELRRTIEVPETELRAYYEENAADFTREEQVRARHILIKTGPERSDEAARQLAAELADRVRAGEDFATLAAEHSEDEGSAQRGGSLGLFGRGQMVPPFEEAAFGAEVGEVVGPVRSDFGYHVIQVEDRVAAGAQPFEQAQPAIRTRLLGERVDQLAEQKARDIATRLAAEGADTSSEALRKLAEEEALAFETTEPFGQSDPIAGLGRAPGLASAVFGLGEPGAVTEAVRLPRGWAVAVLREIREPRDPELDEVREEVRSAVEAEKREAAAVSRLAAARQEHGSDLDAVAGALGLQVQEAGPFGRNDAISGLGRVPAVTRVALAADEGTMPEPVAIDGGAVLFTVTERQRFDAAEFAEARLDTRRAQEGERINALLTSIIERRRRDLEPQYDPQLVETFGIQQQAPLG